MLEEHPDGHLILMKFLFFLETTKPHLCGMLFFVVIVVHALGRYEIFVYEQEEKKVA